MSEKDLILSALLEKGILVEPEVVGYIVEKGGMNYLPKFINKFSNRPHVKYRDIIEPTNLSVRKNTTSHIPKPASEYDWDFKIDMDASVEMRGTGDAIEFKRLFEDRFRKLSKIISSRVQMQNAVSIARLTEGKAATIGIVSDVSTTRKGSIIFKLEDLSGEIKCLTRNAEFILNDEVIGVVGKYSESRKMLYVDEIVRPGCMARGNRKIEEDISVAIISDIHVGSKTFIKGRWEKFLEWLKKGEGEAGKIKYLLIAGDVVDGIGVYPHQEEELTILDIFEQYEALAEYLNEVPDYIKMVIIPGNHDLVRNAEPQPALPREIEKMFNGNVELLSNPTTFTIHGYRFMMYHGASLNNLVELIPGMDYTKTTEIMQYMLDMRHLSPVYGEKVPIVPTPRDYLVIDTVPDVLITGHVHIFSYAMYHGVHMVNASAWQEQTKYQKMMNFNPDPGKVAILNLKEDRMSVKAF
uniref:DNA polymerase II small subunit n=1 Tax=uncultured euryarchaeote Alv-FOS4 TaxID=337893 RepID=Q3SA83_9EURY|nr:DNA polymerase II small subunit [uncultured euryarchaeote Alv-FOS4]